MKRFITVTATIKAWGNSAGIIIPKEKLDEIGVKIGDRIDYNIVPKNPLREAFGKLPPTKKTTEEILREIDKEFESRIAP